MEKQFKRNKQYGLMASIAEFMRQNNFYNHNGKHRLAGKTRQDKGYIVFAGFRDLRDMGFRLKHIQGFRGKHMKSLVDKWVADGLASGTIRNRISVFRVVAENLGKSGMVREPEYYVNDPKLVERKYQATRSKSWEDKGVDVEAKITEVMGDDFRIGLALKLQFLFALRTEESLKFRPHTDDMSEYLMITRGTKGGRERVVAIFLQEQREFLDYLKTVIPIGSSLIPKEFSYNQFNNKYYYRLKKHGICRENGITAHGLRHAALIRLYKVVTGHEPPVNGGDLRLLDRELDSMGRQAVSECAGHARESISAAYIGSKRTPHTVANECADYVDAC